MEDITNRESSNCGTFIPDANTKDTEERVDLPGEEGQFDQASKEESSPMLHDHQYVQAAEITSSSDESGQRNEMCFIKEPSSPPYSLDVDGCGDFFSWMPYEIVMKILSYLRPQELSVSVAPVCRRWHDMSQDPSLWQELDITTISSVHLCRLVRQCTFLRRLILQGRDQISVAEAMVVTDFCTMLEELDLGFSTGVDVNRLQPFVEKCHKLESVNVEGCPNVDSAAVRMLARSQTLRRLNFSHCTKLGDDDVWYLARNFTKITALNIDGICWVTDESVIPLVQLHSDWLTSLTLDGEKLTDCSIEAISECKCLVELSVSFSQGLTDSSLLFIQELTSLRHLCLKKGSEFTAQGLRDMFQGPSLSGLRHLNLSECTALNDDGVLSLAKCCGSTLVDLQLCWCWDITDTGLISILDHCVYLRSLILLGLHSLRGEWLNRIHEELTHLKFLDLQGCNEIEDELIVALVKRKADIKVLDYFGQEYHFCSQFDDLLMSVGNFDSD